MSFSNRAKTLLVAATALSSIFRGSAQSVSSPPASTSPDAAYVESFAKWKDSQVEDLKQNWLPLAGLFWLKPGRNSFGASPDSALIFASGPVHAGEFDLVDNGTAKNSKVTLKLLPGIQASIAGKPVRDDTILAPDTSGHPSVVEMGTLQFHVIVRGNRIGIRLKDTKSEAIKGFHGLAFYPLNLNYRVTAAWVPSGGKQTIDIPNVVGDITAMPVSGTVYFKIDGHEVKLTDLGGDPSKSLFFVFNDTTAKAETYPGGRFLETGPVLNGTVVLDFNRAYNPPCAVTPYATCPLAPKENRLQVSIPAGEKFDKLAHALH